MANLVLKIDRDVQKAAQAAFYYKDIDAFSDKYAPNKVDLMTDVEAVKSSMRNIFMWNQGEEVLYPQFGNNLRKFLYQPLDETSKSELAQEVKRCVEENEKRVQLDDIFIDQNAQDKEYSAITFTLNYHIIGAKGATPVISDTITISGGNKGTIQTEVE